MPSFEHFKPFIVTGLSLGGVYALSGTGIVVLYRATGVLNLAFGAVGAMGALISWALINHTGCPTVLAYVVCILFAAVVTLGYGVIFGPLLARRDPLVKAVGTLGLALILLGLMDWFWPPKSRSMFLQTSNWYYQLGVVRITWTQIIGVLAGVLVAVVTGVFLRYTNLGTAAAKDAVSEAVQAKYYREAITMAYCQPNVVGLLFFHVTDEFNGNTWQSGVYYADDTPKTSLAAVRTTVEAARNGTLSNCAGAAGTASLQTLTLPEQEKYTTTDDTWTGKLTCSRACTYLARIEDTQSGKPVLTVQADVQPANEATIEFPHQKLAPGTYRISVRVWQYGRLGTTVLRYGKPFTVEEAKNPPPPPAAR